MEFSPNWSAAAMAAIICLIAAFVESRLSGEDLAKWLQSLRRPRYFAPLFVWVLAAVLTYILQGIIAYRLIAHADAPYRIPALIVLVAIMAGNIAYNMVLDRTRDPRWAYWGLLWFLPLLLSLQIVLLFADPFSAWLNLLYLVWVAGYDLPVMRALAKRNAA